MVGERWAGRQQRGVMDGPCAPAAAMLVLVAVDPPIVRICGFDEIWFWTPIMTGPTHEHILVETSYVSVQGNVRRLNHRFPLFELALHEGRGVGRRAATRFDSLFGDQFMTSGAREVANGDGIDRLQDVGRRAGPRQYGEPCGRLERRVD
jgi:hypothetical protein